MPTCRLCRESAEQGQAGGWITMRFVGDGDQPSRSIGLFCRARCAAAVLFELDPWGEST
jgi:hypothetical protein